MIESVIIFSGCQVYKRALKNTTHHVTNLYNKTDIDNAETKEVTKKKMNLDVAKLEVKTGSKAPLRVISPASGPSKFKQRSNRQFKSKPPKRGVIGFGEDIPGMEGLGIDITVICPWEAYSHLELHELAQYGII
ncbi:retinal rod rhodopsin-sensitive cGMP 3',5'-cyclic phosphodiesterase subunit gamma-like [Labrus mixtus]|uniref:retinal rod rhodopsin-sensitive cGMP 3',5'-cyclic phosphodiesterase subunit gamma-like n=1 Tax=Labrus mixtus TaxID=508554 RepID=UPI0029C06457|nr:retinal rod rhodopsin-sensitive cGMP 3',5'-cyclic phosphodiesterase subunit gamma-like [Labrus mixtus]